LSAYLIISPWMRDQIIFLFLGEEKGEKEQFAEMNSAKPLCRKKSGTNNQQPTTPLTSLL